GPPPAAGRGCAGGGRADRLGGVCPGRPPGPSWGLTMSEEGGLEEVEESLCAAASFSDSWARACCSCATSPSSACRCWCSRSQLGQGVASGWLIASSLRTAPPLGYTPVNRYGKVLEPRLQLGIAHGFASSSLLICTSRKATGSLCPQNPK